MYSAVRSSCGASCFVLSPMPRWLRGKYLVGVGRFRNHKPKILKLDL